MIECRISINGNSCQLLASGHAHYADPGKDIVCAAFSTATNLLMNFGRRCKDEGLIKGFIAQDEGDFFHIFIDTAGVPAVVAMVDSFYLLLSDLAEQYPQNVFIDLLK